MAATFHINPESGTPNRCKAKISCRFKLSEDEHYETSEEAREAYEKSQAKELLETITNKPSFHGDNLSLTTEQKDYFQKSACIDEDGILLKAYHGSSREFDSFDSNTLGKGNDSWGNGFYFTTKEGTARGYANESSSPDANVKEFYVNLQNPIYMDGKEHMSIQYEFSPEQAYKLLYLHPTAHLQPGEEDEYGNTNFLEDYDDTFWNQDKWSNKDLQNKLTKVAGSYFKNATWGEMENLYSSDRGKEFTLNAMAITGHDGVIVDFKEDGKFFVAWDNSQMKLTSNETPENNDKI